MTTRVALDTNLLEEAKNLGGHLSKTDAVREALKEYVRMCKRRKLVDLFGSVDWDPDYDYKAERRARSALHPVADLVRRQAQERR